MARRVAVSPERILAIAALEFAERGYAGARVDRIAARAGVNKAMLYYHFGSKQGLYRALLGQIFSRVAARLQEVAASDASPEQKIERVIAAMARLMAEHTFFPAIMLREVAEGGAHFDRETLKVLASIPVAVAAVVHQGVADHTFRRIHPISAYFTMFAPILMFFAGTPIRKALSARHLADMSSLKPELFVHQLQESVRLAFAAPRTSRSAPRTRHSTPRTLHAAPKRL